MIQKKRLGSGQDKGKDRKRVKTMQQEKHETGLKQDRGKDKKRERTGQGIHKVRTRQGGGRTRKGRKRQDKGIFTLARA